MLLSELHPGNIITVGTLPVKVVETDATTRTVTICRGDIIVKEDIDYLRPLPITAAALIQALHFSADNLSDQLSLYTKDTTTYCAAIVHTFHGPWLLAITDPQTHDTVRLPVTAIHQVQNSISDFLTSPSL